MAIVAIVGLIIQFNGGATGMSGTKGTSLEYPEPTYWGGNHPDFPEVTEWAYYQFGIRTAAGQQGLDLAPQAFRLVLQMVEQDTTLNDYADLCSLTCRDVCPEEYIKIGLRYEVTECPKACVSYCMDLIEEKYTYFQS